MDVNFDVLCKDDNLSNTPKYIKYRCNKCGVENNMPIEIIKCFVQLFDAVNIKEIPAFDCTHCDGKLEPTNKIELYSEISK